MSAPQNDRSELLDALRGFALFGVVVSNFAMFSFWMFESSDAKQALPGAPCDRAVELVHGVLIDGKFYSIFSLLFGIGFGFFLQKGSDGRTRFLRRMLVLLAIGVCHLRFLWEGDILSLYAALGLLLPLFARLSDRALVVTAASLIASPILIDAISIATNGGFDPGGVFRAQAQAAQKALGVTDEQLNHLVPDGGYAEFARYTGAVWWWRLEHLFASSRLPKVLGLFVLGLWVARRQLFVDPTRHRALLMRTLRLGLVVGVPGCWLATKYSSGSHPPRAWHELVPTFGYAIGVVPLALAYASAFALLWTNERWRARLVKLAPMGRMALTNYLTQTLVGLLLFTGMGFGLGTRVSAITFTGIAVALYVVQVVFSTLWLRAFRFGPCEWVWRVLTYGALVPMRR